MKKYISEIFFTTDNADENEWQKLILEISKLNGLFRSWKIYIQVERNIIRYYLVTRKKIPTILSCSGNFLIKTISHFDKIKTNLSFLYLVTNKEKNIVDIYDKNESKYNLNLKQVEVRIRSFKKDNYFSHTKLYFENKNGRKCKAWALFFIPNMGISVDFSKHTRFLYRKEGSRYLKLEKSMSLFSKKEGEENLLEINTFPYTDEKYYLNILNYDFDKHSLIVGASGTGKSKLISSFIKNIYDNEILRQTNKVIVIDPHGSLENDIGGLENTEVINMKEKENTTDLWINSDENVSSSTEIILTILKSIFGEQYNSKLERVLRHSVYLLLKKKQLNFETLRKLLTYTEYRTKLIRESDDIEDHIKEFFLTDFNEIKTKSYQEAISPIISLIEEMQMLPAFQNEGKRSVEELIKNNFLTLFSLDQAELGEKVTKTISGLILGIIFNLVQNKKFYEHIILIVDEVAVVENPILRNLLSEARKYNLSIILAQQYFGQVSKELREAIFSNVMNYYTFRVSREDAVILSNHLQMEMAVKNSYHNRVKLITELPNRDCIVRISKEGRVIPSFRGRTLDFTPIPIRKNQIISSKEDKNTKEKDIELIKDEEFSLGKTIDLRALMNSQSTSRRKIKYE